MNGIPIPAQRPAGEVAIRVDLADRPASVQITALTIRDATERIVWTMESQPDLLAGLLREIRLKLRPPADTFRGVEAREPKQRLDGLRDILHLLIVPIPLRRGRSEIGAVEMIIDRRLVHARFGDDGADAGTIIAAFGEQPLGRLQNALAVDFGWPRHA